MDYKDWKIPAKQVQSLCWDGETLVDWVSGGTRYQLDGTNHSSNIYYAHPFDSALMSSSGIYTAIYKRCGTKALLLKHGKILREIDRSFYHAESYEYPILFITLPNGNDGLIHCPGNYNKLEIDDLESGLRLTNFEERKPEDIFHSRLSVSPNQQWILSAGWYWHPWGTANIYSTIDALNYPPSLDSLGLQVTTSEVSSAAFMDDNRVIVASSEEGAMDESDADPLGKAGPHSIGIFNIAFKQFESVAKINEPIGTLHPINSEYVLSLYLYPKLIEIKTGQIVQRWETLNTGKQQGSIIWGKLPPPFAYDTKLKRFALGDKENITIVEFNI